MEFQMNSGIASMQSMPIFGEEAKRNTHTQRFADVPIRCSGVAPKNICYRNINYRCDTGQNKFIKSR